jgi:hypothetical protein
MVSESGQNSNLPRLNGLQAASYAIPYEITRACDQHHGNAGHAEP